MKKVLLFDFFGVIGYDISPVWFRQYFPDDVADAAKHRLVAPGDLGQISEKEMFENIGREVGIAPCVVRNEWLDMVTVNHELADFIKNARRSHPVYLLSNALSEFLREILEKNDLFELFDGVFISAELHLAKPDPAFFCKCLEKIGVRAEDAIMIDDNANNLAGAESIGINTILFRNNESFKKKFKEFCDI